MSKTVKLSKDKSQLTYDAYWDAGNGHHLLREALPIYHKENLYNYIKRHDIVPEEYGVYHPIRHEYSSLSRNELLNKVVELELQIKQMEKFI
jgi:hypothetical protein